MLANRSSATTSGAMFITNDGKALNVPPPPPRPAFIASDGRALFVPPPPKAIPLMTIAGANDSKPVRQQERKKENLLALPPELVTASSKVFIIDGVNVKCLCCPDVLLQLGGVESHAIGKKHAKNLLRFPGPEPPQAVDFEELQAEAAAINAKKAMIKEGAFLAEVDKAEKKAAKKAFNRYDYAMNCRAKYHPSEDEKTIIEDVLESMFYAVVLGSLDAPQHKESGDNRRKRRERECDGMQGTLEAIHSRVGAPKRKRGAPSKRHKPEVHAEEMHFAVGESPGHGAVNPRFREAIDYEDDEDD